MSQIIMLVAFTVLLFLSALEIGSSAKWPWPWQLMTMIEEESPLMESRLDNPNYFEGDLDISQLLIDAYYEQQSGKNVRIKASLFAELAKNAHSEPSACIIIILY